MEEYVITLADGTEITATLNGGVYESEEEVTAETFEGNLDDVSYELDGQTVELGDCKGGFLCYEEDREVYQFIIMPLTEEEKTAKAIQQAMNDITDAVLEMSEIIYGEE